MPHLVRARACHASIWRQRTSFGSLATIYQISEKVVRELNISQGDGPVISDQYGVLDTLPGVANTVTVIVDPRLTDDANDFGAKTIELDGGPEYVRYADLMCSFEDLGWRFFYDGLVCSGEVDVGFNVKDGIA